MNFGEMTGEMTKETGGRIGMGKMAVRDEF